MTLQERIAASQQRSVQLYLQRQNLEQQRQQIALQIQMTDLNLMKEDGTFEALSAVVADEQKAP